MKFEIDKGNFWLTETNALFVVPDRNYLCNISKGIVETEIMIHVDEPSELANDAVLAEFCYYVGVPYEEVTQRNINHGYWAFYSIPTDKVPNNLFFKKLALLAERNRFDLLVRQTNKISIDDLKKILELRQANGN